MKRLAAVLLLGLAACSDPRGTGESRPEEFLRMYNDIDQRLLRNASEAAWRATTDATPQHTGERVGAEAALAAFRGSRYVIENARRLLASRDSLAEIEFRQLDKILLNAAESPGTIPEIVQSRIEAEANLAALMDSFVFCLERRGGRCVKPVTPNEIDLVLRNSRNLAERRRYWEASKQSGPALKPGLAEVRDLRNRVARELGYSSYLHLQVADYGMSVGELMQLMDRTLGEVRPLYAQLHRYARRTLSERYGEKIPEEIPAHWLPNRWGQEWPGLVKAVDLDPYFRGRSPEWVVEQAARFYTSLGFPALPKSFWAKSDLYQLPPKAGRKKNTHASAWHIDRDRDVRALMNVVPNAWWFETAHHELGHVYYYTAYSTPRVPHVLREGLNRAFHEALGDLITLAVRQEEYLRQVGVLPQDVQLNSVQLLLNEALDSSVVFLPFAAGTMTHFEFELYEKNLPPDQFNQVWWNLVRRHQGIAPPAERGEQFCDACTKSHIIDDAAQYYDYAIATLIKFQLHDHIARKILKEDPRRSNYAGRREVGQWLGEIMALGATRDWRQVLKEKTGEDLSARALVDYFRPLEAHLQAANAQP